MRRKHYIVTYDISDDNGKLIATARAPFNIKRFTHPVILGDVMHAVILDEDDVQHIVRARIRR